VSKFWYTDVVLSEDSNHQNRLSWWIWVVLRNDRVLPPSWDKGGGGKKCAHESGQLVKIFSSQSTLKLKFHDVFLCHRQLEQQ